MSRLNSYLVVKGCRFSLTSSPRCVGPNFNLTAHQSWKCFKEIFSVLSIFLYGYQHWQLRFFSSGSRFLICRVTTEAVDHPFRLWRVAQKIQHQKNLYLACTGQRAWFIVYDLDDNHIQYLLRWREGVLCYYIAKLDVCLNELGKFFIGTAFSKLSSERLHKFFSGSISDWLH